MVELRQVYFQYASSAPLIRDISFHLSPGEILGLLGHNGSGKSTIMKLIGGLLKPQKGEVRLNDIPIRSHQPSEIYRKLSLMIEGPSLYGHLSVWDNLRIQGLYYQVEPSVIRTRLEQLGMLQFKGQKVSKLSTGMKQRVGLAMALLPDPDILVLDEPTNGLDPEGIIQIRSLIHELADQGKTLIVSSHLLSEIEKVAGKVLILKNGENVFQGPIDNLKGHRDLESFYMRYV